MKNVNFPDDCRLILYIEQEGPLQKENFFCLKADKRNRQRICFLKIQLFSPYQSLHIFSSVTCIYWVHIVCLYIYLYPKFKTREKYVFKLKLF